MNQLGKFYITTPIYYVNDKPHIGHAYTTILADIMARWHRLSGDSVFFLTGTDEHGEKVEAAAAKAGQTPQRFVDSIVGTYVEAWKKLGISYDGFVRTTSPEHVRTVQEFIRRIKANGDVYKGQYEGWYCVSDESFWTDLQLKDGKCPECGREVKKVREESYFFRLSAYQDKLLEFYKANPSFLSPASRSSEILNRVREGLKDVSISRTTVKWAVPFPDDANHWVYVWVDALINYISAIGWPEGEGYKTYWPADVHLVGKEINWFHSVIWPALLLSAKLPLPKKVFAHGWWTADGQKMSKSKGNFVDPFTILGKYSVDAFRYFLVREMPLGSDGDFSEKSLVARINGELVADLGNLVYRVLTLAERFGSQPSGNPELESKLNITAIKERMAELDTFGALNAIWDFIRETNRYVNEKKVWALQGGELSNALYNLLESCRIISILLSPFLPETSARINEQLGVAAGTIADCRFGVFNGRVKKGDYLFKKVEQKQG